MISTEELIETNPNLYKIDRELHQLVQKIELLDYINPINIEQEKRHFFGSKYNINPNFKYKKIDFNAHRLQQALFSQDIDSIKDEESRKFYREVIYDYSGLIQCIETIGKGKKFYFNALKSFGTPTDKDVANAQFILHFNDEQFDQEMFPVFNSEDALGYFTEFSKKFKFDYHVKMSNKISAAAMVQNNTQTLFLKKNHRFSANQLKVLANHEIGVHMVTTFNGLSHLLKIFHNGFPNNVETQEGLAVFSEYMSGCLTLYRLKELSYRVIAADSLRKGFNFCDTFDLLHNQYKLNREESYNISLRAHRGGGFTKDYTYLTGLKKVYNYYHEKKDLNILLTGKVNIDHVELIEQWKRKGMIGENPYRNFAFDQNNNQSKTIDFILENLK